MAEPNQLTWETFLYMAREAGLNTEDPHMEELFPYVENALRGLAALRDMDTSNAEPDMAFIPDRDGPDREA